MFITKKPSDLLIAAEQSCNNEERLERWKRKKIKLAIEQRRHHIIHTETGNKGALLLHNLRFKHH